MYQITKIETEYSECGELENRTFTSAIEFDIAILRAMVHEGHEVTDLSYYKTDTTVTWEDGNVFTFRLDVNRADTFSSDFAERYRNYCGYGSERNRPEYIPVDRWEEAQREYQEFFETYAI